MKYQQNCYGHFEFLCTPYIAALAGLVALTMYVCFEDEGSELFSREGIRIHFFDINLVIEAPPGFPWFIKPSASQLKCHQIHIQSGL